MQNKSRSVSLKLHKNPSPNGQELPHKAWYPESDKGGSKDYAWTHSTEKDLLNRTPVE